MRGRVGLLGGNGEYTGDDRRKKSGGPRDAMNVKDIKDVLLLLSCGGEKVNFKE